MQITKDSRMSGLKVIDISPLLSRSTSSADSVADVISELREATQQVGFFYVRGHGVSRLLQTRLEDVARRFFALPAEEKENISMSRGGKAWRGYFAVGDELTSGLPDQKEGIYFGSELPEDHPLPLHGPNLWPSGDLGLEMREVVLQYMSEVQSLGSVLMLAVAESLGVDSALFGEAFSDPTVLFRIFNYPPHNPKYGELSQAVGEHTDYGYLTILKQDPSGGLQVRGADGQWIDAPYVEDTFVINLGDALEHCTGGLIKATPHRVVQRVGATSDRLSFPFFYDPNFRAQMVSVADSLTPEQQRVAESNRRLASSRWDRQDPSAYRGTYGRYLLTKVAKVFPGLAAENINDIVQSL